MDLIGVIMLSFAMGIVAGLRSMVPLAALALAASARWVDVDRSPLAPLGGVAARYLLPLLAVGEIIGDKLPFTPSRKKVGPFVARVVVGAFSGMVLCAASRLPVMAGVIAGAAGAAVGTVAGHDLRARLVKRLGCPDWWVAVVEDAIAIGGAFWVVSRF